MNKEFAYESYKEKKEEKEDAFTGIKFQKEDFR